MLCLHPIWNLRNKYNFKSLILRILSLVIMVLSSYSMKEYISLDGCKRKASDIFENHENKFLNNITKSSKFSSYKVTFAYNIILPKQQTQIVALYKLPH